MGGPRRRKLYGKGAGVSYTSEPPRFSPLADAMADTVERSEEESAGQAVRLPRPMPSWDSRVTLGQKCSASATSDTVALNIRVGPRSRVSRQPARCDNPGRAAAAIPLVRILAEFAQSAEHGGTTSALNRSVLVEPLGKHDRR
jgi:hypothetical protein